MADDTKSPTDLQLSKLQEMVMNVEFSRARMMRALLDPRRDLDDECGWFKGNPSPEDYYNLYDRFGIAARMVEVFPKECWQVTPMVYEEEDGETATEFEAAWDEMLRGLRSERSWHQDSHGSVLWEYHQRLDIMAGIGRYGVMLLGFNDVVGNDLSQPVIPSTKLKLNYLRVFPEALAQITAYESDLSSPRVGMPAMYNVTLNDPRELATGTAYASTTTIRVHWTRLIHVPSDGGVSSSEFAGPERMRTNLNDLMDLRKVYGASSEGYWKSGFPILTAETHPSLGGDVEVNELKLKNMFENMMNGLSREGVLMGMTLKSTAPSVVDPTPHIDKLLESICIRMGIPVPVFKGYEIGEQASENNSEDWDDRVAYRENNWLTPRQIVPFIDRLIWAQVLPEPTGYTVEWPSLADKTDDQKADTSLKVVQAVALYVTSGANVLMTPFDFFTRVLGWTDDEAQSVVDRAINVDTEDQVNSPLLGLVGGVTGMIELFKTAKDGAVSEEQLKQLIMLFFKLSEDQADEIIADGLTPVAIEAGDPTPAEPQAPMPIKVKEGETLVKPADVIPKA